MPGLLIVCLAGGLISGFYLLLYRHYIEPIGWDTARYLEQTNLVAQHGLSGVSGLALPRPSQVLTSRVGFPVMVLALSRLFFTSTFKAASVLPIVCIAATALAAGAFVSYTLRRGPWELAIVALIVGTSAAMVQLIAGAYADNLIAFAIFAAALVPIAAATRADKGLTAAIVLLGVGGLVHVAFFKFMLLVLGLAALAYTPWSWRSWRSGHARLLSTPSGRLGLTVGGAGAFTAAGIYGLLRSTPSPVDLSRGEFTKKLRESLPLYRLPFTVPLAAVGLVSVGAEAARRGRPPEDGDVGSRREPSAEGFDRRFFLTLMVVWGAVSAGGIALYYLGRASPAHRFLAFLLPFPIFVAIGLVFIGRWLARTLGGVLSRRAAAAVGIAVVVVGIAGAGLLSYRDLYVKMSRSVEWIDEGKVTDAEMAQAYLRTVGISDSQPVVFIIDDRGPNPQVFIPEEAHIMRSTFSPTRIQHASFYVGTPENYLAGRPTFLPGDTRNYNTTSRRFWLALQPVLGQKPAALLLGSYNPDYREFSGAHPELVVANGVVALNRPKPATPVAKPDIPSSPRGIVRAGLYGVGTLTVLTLIGLGWALALLPKGIRPFEVLALGSAFGIAFLIIAGTLVDAAHVGLSGPGGGLAGPVIGAVGWVLGGWRLARQGPDLFAA